MYSRAILWLAFGIWILVSNLAFAQPVADSSSVKSEALRLGINTFSVGSAADWRYTKIGKQRLEAGLGQYLVYNHALETKRLITNNYFAGFSHQLWLTRRWQWQNKAWQTSYVANKTRLGQVRSNLQYTAWESQKSVLFFLGGVGVVNDKRVQYNDLGPSFNLEGTWFGRGDDSTLMYRVSGTVYEAFIQPRKNELYVGNASVTKEFPAGGLLSGEAGYLRRKVEDYLGTDIQSIVSDTVYGRVRFQYGLSKDLTFSSNNQVSTPNRSFFYRNIESQAETRNVRYFQTEYQSLNTLLYLVKRLRFSFNFEARQRYRTYDIINRLNPQDPNYLQQLLAYKQNLEQEQIKDIREQYLTYTTDIRWRMARNHVLKLNYVAQLLRVEALILRLEITHIPGFDLGFDVSVKKGTVWCRYLVVGRKSKVF